MSVVKSADTGAAGDIAGPRICLISLYSSSSIGLRYLVSILKARGVAVTVVFFKDKDIALDLMARPTLREYELLLGTVARLKPTLVGIGVRSSFVSIATEITSRIHDRLGIPVVWGSTHATVAPEDSLRHADMICLGEGEHAMIELAQSLANGNSRRDIENLWYKDNEGRIVSNPLRPLFEDLDTLPFPDYGDEHKYFIHNDEVIDGDPGRKAFNLDVMTSRGCPYHCTYCSNSMFHELYRGKGKAVRRRSPGNVLDELKVQAAKLPGLRRIDFIDEVFSWDKEWVEEFIGEYKRNIGLPFHCMQHPNAIHKDVLRMLRDGGLERVEMGIQSGSERVRQELFLRPVTDDKLIGASQILHDLKITPFYDIIVDNPFETPEDKKNGLDLLLKIKRPYHMHMFSLTHFPNTALTKKALAANLITEDQVEGRATAAFDQFYVSLSHPRPSEDRFWLSLYSLTSKSFVPKALIRTLSRVPVLKRHPAPLVAFANACNYAKLGGIAIKWMCEGKPVLRSLTRKQKSSKQGSRIV
jgi:anaerobic magnesium-protoporphyrin IX monomethyl ester cyclase